VTTAEIRDFDSRDNVYRWFVLQLLFVQKSASDSNKGFFPWIKSAARSAIIIVGALMFELTTSGITEASTTRRPDTPLTRS
jgi:hypothetical protein